MTIDEPVISFKIIMPINAEMPQRLRLCDMIHIQIPLPGHIYQLQKTVHSGDLPQSQVPDVEQDEVSTGL